jgi:hypothetical protein
MKKSIIFTGVLLLIIAVFVAGCTSNSPASTATPVPTTPQLSTVDPSDMALTLSDVPAGFTIKEGSEKTSSDVSQEYIRDGWEKGYYVQFDRVNTATQDFEILEQTLSVYPIGHVNLVMTQASTEILQTANATNTVEKLSDPSIGDSSAAFRTKTSIDGFPVTGFTIFFVKKDVFEALDLEGTSADYATLKNLANVSASKIR